MRERLPTAPIAAGGLIAGFAVAQASGSHVLALAIGAWPAVIVVSAAMAAVCWGFSDSRPAPSPRADGARPAPDPAR